MIKIYLAHKKTLLAALAICAAFLLGRATAPEAIVVPPDWAVPDVRPGDNCYRYTIPFEMGGERYLAVFQHRTEQLSQIAGWSVRIGTGTEARAKEIAERLQETMPQLPDVNTPRPIVDDLGVLDRR